MEKDAGTGRLSTLTVVESPAAQDICVLETTGDTASETTVDTAVPDRRRSWPTVVAVVLFVIAGGVGVGGYLATKANRGFATAEAASVAAVAAAKDCVAATQPPDAAALPAAQHKLSQCSTGNFGDQSTWYGEVLAQAYQAVDVKVRVPEMHAALERVNDDGSINVLVVFRATVSQPGMADRDNSYRVRVKMVPVDNVYKVAELDQVAK